ncbi:conserved hypothetical protein [Thiomonas sp. X19]|uniref:type II toxin-antitoxin system RelE/ParE family toxin n=1 Tax=Thiomonas sp. X19 TaxID=1050370 RepID=UPI000B6A42CB|nr:type II toxin-antitoxin system RelE/ParE family toxin [Thiomonas sp. X19]SCC91704.1 conserved hypothetical protein [Thiomonas sp. X19]
MPRTKPSPTHRVFKTAWFAKAASKGRITDAQLCAAIKQAMLGQADDLGGGVFKKRLNDNRHRSIILAKGGRLWVYAYLFAKKDRSNIEDDELAGFRKLATAYSRKTDAEIQIAIHNGDLQEICHDDQTDLQE